MELFAESLLNGILIGGILITMAVGFSLSFGVMEIIDFAVGEWLMLASFLTYSMTNFLKIEPLLLVPLVAIVFFFAGFFIQPLIARAVHGKQSLAVLMGLVFTFGISLILRGSALSIWGFNVRSVSSMISGTHVPLGNFIISSTRLVAFSFGILSTLALLAFLRFTKTGMAIRATAQNGVVAETLGVNVPKIRSLVYAIYAAMTGMAGVFIGILFSISAEMGVLYTIFIFFVVVLAGLGYIQGVIYAAVFLGVLQSLITIYIGAQYVLLLVFATLYVVLLIAPKGLLGKGL
ncbi:MAG: branched-chain amino acid ABC transporter permease [Desulfobacterales bacterium]|nr:MAG: branched-chain amino acid ABC transporter permease [Desulfobacterales bacterium]